MTVIVVIVYNNCYVHTNIYVNQNHPGQEQTLLSALAQLKPRNPGAYIAAAALPAAGKDGALSQEDAAGGSAVPADDGQVLRFELRLRSCSSKPSCKDWMRPHSSKPKLQALRCAEHCASPLHSSFSAPLCRRSRGMLTSEQDILTDTFSILSPASEPYLSLNSKPQPPKP